MPTFAPLFFSRNHPLVTQFVRISETGPDHVLIRGRKAGLLAWLFTHLGLDLTISLELSGSRAELITSSLSGRSHEIIPLTKISAIGVGYTKPALVLLLAFALLPAGCAMLFYSLFAAFFFLALAFALFFLFQARKTLTLYITSESGSTAVLSFQRSFIESVCISEADAYRIVNILTHLLENASASPIKMRPVRPALQTAVQDPFAGMNAYSGNETAAGIKVGPHPLAPPAGRPMPPDLPKYPTHSQTHSQKQSR